MNTGLVLGFRDWEPNPLNPQTLHLLTLNLNVATGMLTHPTPTMPTRQPLLPHADLSVDTHTH